MEGLDLAFVAEKFGDNAKLKLQAAGKKWEAGEKLKTDNQKIILTKAGKLFADGIAADLFF
jgi:oxygen-independent coproporphyrinogen III oxidase